MFEARDFARLPRVIEPVESGHQIAEDGAAETAILQHHDGVVAGSGKCVIEADLSKLIDHDGRVRYRRSTKRAVEQRRLSAA